jgi:CheY-like chemotaxis protein
MSLVLVVDDEHGVAEILEAMIEEEGHRVLIADNAGIGLKLMAEERPDLIFTDTQMPGADGPAMVRAMEADPRLRGLPVVAMSAMPEGEVGRDYPRYSAFLKKPFRMVQVSRLLRRFLEPRRGP